MSWYYTDGDDFYADGICYRLSHGTMVNSGMCPPESIRRLCRAQAGMGGPVTRDDQRREERPDGDGAGDGRDARIDSGADGPSQDGREAGREGSSMTDEKKAWYEGVPAPVDADGNVVPLTTRTLYDEDGQEISIVEYAIIYSKDTGFQVWSVRSSYGLIMALNRCHLERPDSWERLEGDIESMLRKNLACYYFGHGKSISCLVCPAHTLERNCKEVATCDILRRIKALAGSGEGQ